MLEVELIDLLTEWFRGEVRRRENVKNVTYNFDLNTWLAPPFSALSPSFCYPHSGNVWYP